MHTFRLTVICFRILGGMLLIGMGAAPLGCGRSVQDADTQDLRDPLVRRAYARKQEGDPAGALGILCQALERRPGLAQAHLAAAELYAEQEKNYVRAIYHYERYLELRPQTEKRELIEDLIRKARMSLAATLSNPSVSDLEARNKALQEENLRLKAALHDVRANLAQCLAAGPRREAAPIRPVAAPAPATGPAPAGRGANPEVYVVQPNDTLSSVAGKVYQDPRRWKVIYQANQRVLDGSEKLKMGQTLVIPR